MKLISIPNPIPTKPHNSLNTHTHQQKLCFCINKTMEFQVQAILVLLMFLSIASGDQAKDREECAEQLAGLATCLPYVGGQAKAPTPDCCSGLKQVLKNNKKCLCVVIRDRNDPDLGLNINATLALGLPTVCHASANVSKCPGTTKTSPHSVVFPFSSHTTTLHWYSNITSIIY